MISMCSCTHPPRTAVLQRIVQLVKAKVATHHIIIGVDTLGKGTLPVCKQHAFTALSHFYTSSAEKPPRQQTAALCICHKQADR